MSTNRVPLRHKRAAAWWGDWHTGADCSCGWETRQNHYYYYLVDRKMEAHLRSANRWWKVVGRWIGNLFRAPENALIPDERTENASD